MAHIEASFALARDAGLHPAAPVAADVGRVLAGLKTHVDKQARQEDFDAHGGNAVDREALERAAEAARFADATVVEDVLLNAQAQAQARAQAQVQAAAAAGGVGALLAQVAAPVEPRVLEWGTAAFGAEQFLEM